MKSDELTRREVLAIAGSGVFVFLPDSIAGAQEAARLPSRPSYPSDFNAYLHIAEDGRVTCLVGKVELGQGSMTALAQLLAEELDVAFENVDMVMGDTARCPWDMGTFGSLSIRQFGPILRAAAAEGRAVLLQMASEHLRAPVARLQVHGGVVTDPSQDRRVTYAQLVQGKRIERHLANIQPKAPGAFHTIGKTQHRKDALDKVTGKAQYAADRRIPGTLHASILRPPAHGATLRSVDTSAAEKIDGVRVVKDGGLVAVLHERPDVAAKALALVHAAFDPPRTGVNDRTIFDHLLKTAPPPQLVHQSGDFIEGLKLATTVVEHTYLNSYVAHSPMETHSAVATVDNGQATVWASTQTPFPLRQQVAQALGFTPDNVRVITPYVGGGFGGKSASGQGVEAARLAKITGRPVQVVMDRGEEFFHDTFRPAAVVTILSGVTAEGKMSGWDYKVYGAGDREAKQFYDIRDQRTMSSGGWSGGNPAGMNPFAVGPWRAPSVNTNTFARECHIDVMAKIAGADPVEFRLAHLTDKRMRRVLEAAAKQFGWQAAKIPSGRGVGVACGMYAGTCVATMAEVAADKATGQVQVRRVVCAQDQGLTINPDGSRQQIEGSITMGLGYALTEEVRFADGEILERNFDTYEIPRFSWVPKIDIVLIDNPETPALGCGEPPIVTMGAVVANAVYDALGARVFQLPITPARVKQAIAIASADGTSGDPNQVTGS